VFDLGGGTFDVTIVDIVGNDITVVATTGDHQLGGKDWDDLLIKHVAEEFKKKHGKDPRDDLAASHDLRAKCVSAKISLTRRPKVNVFYDYDGMILRTEVSRELFEELSTGLMGRTEALAKDVLDDARIKADDLDTVLLAGGSTRMPMVRDLIQRLFGKAPATDINPDECVALGAALTAALESAKLTGEKPPIDIRTHDVTSHSLGMVAYKDSKLHNSRIITRNSRIPCERSRDSFVTTHDSQTVVDLWLVQGENPDPLECAVLGHFEFYGIPPRPRERRRSRSRTATTRTASSRSRRWTSSPARTSRTDSPAARSRSTTSRTAGSRCRWRSSWTAPARCTARRCNKRRPRRGSSSTTSSRRTDRSP
jgi:molecular chaperone DnaK